MHVSLQGISTTTDDPLVVKLYKVWVQDGGTLKQLASNLTNTIPELLADHNYEMAKLIVMFGDDRIAETNLGDALAALGITKQKPIRL